VSRANRFTPLTCPRADGPGPGKKDRCVVPLVGAATRSAIGAVHMSSRHNALCGLVHRFRGPGHLHGTPWLLARQARGHNPAEAHKCVDKLDQLTVCQILDEQEVKPHRVLYYVERRDPEFKDELAAVLYVYRQVKILKEPAAASKKNPSDAVAIISYDEKPGIQAVATTMRELSPGPAVHATFARVHEYKRLGMVSVLAGIDLLSDQVHALVKERHHSREFIEVLQFPDAVYLARTAIVYPRQPFRTHLQQTKAWLAGQPARPLRIYRQPRARLLAEPGRRPFVQVCTLRPSPPPRCVKLELKDRIITAMDDIDQHQSSIHGHISLISPRDHSNYQKAGLAFVEWRIHNQT
jgi:hypothetical protein